jgi:hypothetical protein
VLFKYAGTAHLYSERPVVQGAGRVRHPVCDSGVGPARFQVKGELRVWASVKESGNAASAIIVATDVEVCGRTGLEGEERQAAVRTFAAGIMQSGARGLIVILGTHARHLPKIWSAQGLGLPVAYVQPGESAAGLLEAAAQGLPSLLIRSPVEAELAFQLKVLADSDGHRTGLCALTRKLLRLGDLDLAALCLDIMEPVPQMYAVDEVQRRTWANTLVDVVCYICIFLAAHTQELCQAPVHAERAGAVEIRAAKAMAILRTQVGCCLCYLQGVCAVLNAPTDITLRECGISTNAE